MNTKIEMVALTLPKPLKDLPDVGCVYYTPLHGQRLRVWNDTFEDLWAWQLGLAYATRHECNMATRALNGVINQ